MIKSPIHAFDVQFKIPFWINKEYVQTVHIKCNMIQSLKNVRFQKFNTSVHFHTFGMNKINFVFALQINHILLKQGVNHLVLNNKFGLKLFVHVSWSNHNHKYLKKWLRCHKYHKYLQYLKYHKYHKYNKQLIHNYLKLNLMFLKLNLMFLKLGLKL